MGYRPKMKSLNDRLIEFLNALKEIEDIADSAGNAEEQIFEIRAICKEVLE